MYPELVDRKEFNEYRRIREKEVSPIFGLSITYGETLPDVVIDLVIAAFKRKNSYPDIMSYFDGRWQFLGSTL